MSTNYRVTTPKEFFQKHTPKNTQNSFFDQLSGVLKTSLNFVWNYVKTIDVNTSVRSQINHDQEKTHQAVSNANGLGVKSNQTNNKGSLLNDQKRLLNDSKSKDSQSKKQMLKQKKQRKRISFDEFALQEQRKLNESFIRKNIEIKKALNRSLISQQQDNSLLVAQDILDKEITNRKRAENQHSILQKNINGNNNNNESLILNISDIDSECNFNILNNEQLNDESSKDQRQRSKLFADNEEDFEYGLNEGETQAKVPQLQLKEYPFLVHGIKTSSRTKNLRSDERKSSFHKAQSNTRSKQRISTTQQPEHDFIDVDNLYYPPLDHNAKKRLAPPFVKSNQANIRKRVKHNSQQYIKENIKISDKLLQRYEKFDRLVMNRYEKMIESSIGDKQDDKEQQLSLKQQYEKFLRKNFGAMIYEKDKLQKESLQVGNKQSQNGPKRQRVKFSQYLKPVDFQPIIERKKLFTFTKECQSKISVSEELKKSVHEDKQRQYRQELRKKQQEEERKRREEQEVKRRQQEEMRKKLQEERMLRLRQEQQRMRQAEKESQKQPEEESKRNDEIEIKAHDLTNGEKEQQRQQTIDNAVVNKQASPQTQGQKEQTKQKVDKQPAKPFSLFDAPKVSLFSLAGEKKPSQQSPKPAQTTVSPPKESQKVQTTETKESKSVDSVKPNQPAEKKPVQLTTKPSQKEEPKKTEPTKVNPFLAPAKPSNITLLQELINSKKDDNSIFKSTIASTPLTSNSPIRQPPTQNPSGFLSPVHNTSQYSNLDSSMCEQSESNITPGNSQIIGGNLLPGSNLNGSFLNASFSSQANSVFPPSSNPLFNAPTTGGLFNTSFNTAGQSGGLFGNQTSGMFPSTGVQSTQNAMFEAVNKIPSFMQNQPSIAPTISPQNAVSLFSQRSPSKNEPQSLFAPPPLQQQKASTSRRDKRKQQRIR